MNIDQSEGWELLSSDVLIEYEYSWKNIKGNFLIIWNPKYENIIL